MSKDSHKSSGLSPGRIAGFACNQGFVFFLFYMGFNQVFDADGLVFERADLLATLLFIMISFGIVRIVPTRVLNVLLSRPALIVYAFLLALGALIPSVVGVESTPHIPWEGIPIGISIAFFLTAWGRTFGEVSTKVSVPEVFFGSVVGAMFGLIISLIPFEQANYIFYMLPFLSAIALLGSAKSFDESLNTTFAGAVDSETALLSVKIITGTVLFGIAAGFMETFNTGPGQAEMPSYPLSLLLFGAFAIGSLTLLLSDGFGKGAALNKAYRLAVFIMMIGFLLIPVPQFANSFVPGEAIVLAGYLGLMAVLISLFLMLAKVTQTDTAASFSRGFAALFGGEFIGVGLANLINSMQPSQETPYVVVVFASVLILIAYIFLFTERDFVSLSEIMSNTDSFEDNCRAIVSKYGLSKREAEILPFALKGRTGERISQEMHISKSTVDTHLRRIYGKTHVHSRQELMDIEESMRS